MPPKSNADEPGAVLLQESGTKDAATIATNNTKRDLSSLKSSELCIEGIIYDISDFDHPGGESISLFGGQDATIQYKMIHPHHNYASNDGNNKNYYLSKMKQTGVLAKYEQEYTFESAFAKDLKAEVFAIVKRHQQFGTYGFFLRAFLFMALFFYLQYLWVMQGSSVWLAIAYGVAAGFIGTGVQHDANHGAASRRPWVNELMGYMNDILGNPKILWQQQHWTHHAHTNDVSRDPDSAGAEPFLLFYNYPKDSEKRQWYHKFQGYYLVGILSGFWAALFFSLDFATLQKGSVEHFFRTDTTYIRKNYWISQLVHLYYRVTFVLPPFIHHGLLSYKPFLHISVFALSVSLYLGMLFTLSHNFEGVDEDDLSLRKTSSNNKDELICWYSRQVETSSTYGGLISGWMTGGLNFQIEHHLFPRMSSAWYPHIAPAVRRVCAKHNVRYAHFPWIWQNMYSTFMRVSEVGNNSINKEKQS